MIHFPQQLSDLAALSGEFRAGATDLQERRRASEKVTRNLA